MVYPYRIMETNQPKTCPYTNSKGGRIGQQCGSLVKREGIYCSKHNQAMKRHAEAVNRLVNRKPKLDDAN
jgi:hypothetical protein